MRPADDVIDALRYAMGRDPYTDAPTWHVRQQLDEAEKRVMFWREKYTVARRQCRQLVAAALCAIGAGFTLGYMLAEAFCGS